MTEAWTISATHRFLETTRAEVSFNSPFLVPILRDNSRHYLRVFHDNPRVAESGYGR